MGEHSGPIAPNAIPRVPWGAPARALAREVAKTLLLTATVVLAVRGVVQPFWVEGPSMDPTLYSGQYLLINTARYARLDPTALALPAPEPGPGGAGRYVFGGPQRGDIVVLRVPGDQARRFIKRVVGLPGDTIRIVGGTLYLDGEPLDEPYVRYREDEDLEPTSIPPDSYFVLGDNRPDSGDSRHFGAVPADHLVGRAWLGPWPSPTLPPAWAAESGMAHP